MEFLYSMVVFFCVWTFDSAVWATRVVGHRDMGEDGPCRMDREGLIVHDQCHTSTEDPEASKAGHDVEHNSRLFSNTDADGDSILLILLGKQGKGLLMISL